MRTLRKAEPEAPAEPRDDAFVSVARGAYDLRRLVSACDGEVSDDVSGLARSTLGIVNCPICGSRLHLRANASSSIISFRCERGCLPEAIKPELERLLGALPSTHLPRAERDLRRARHLWEQAGPADGSPVVRGYLHRQRISPKTLPPALRWIESSWELVARFDALDGSLAGVEVTHLAKGDHGMPRYIGNRSGLCRLAPAVDKLALAPSVEAGLRMSESTRPIWAAADRLAPDKFMLPDSIRDVLIVAAKDDGTVALAHQLFAQGRSVKIEPPSEVFALERLA